MTKTLETLEELTNIHKEVKKLGEKFGFDIKNDEFTVIQPYDDNQAIVFDLSEDNGREVRVNISDNVYVLPKKSGTLDVFEKGEDDE